MNNWSRVRSTSRAPRMEQLELRRMLARDHSLFGTVGDLEVTPGWFASFAHLPSSNEATVRDDRPQTTVVSSWEGKQVEAIAAEWIVQLSASALSQFDSVASLQETLASGMKAVRGLGRTGNILVRSSQLDRSEVAGQLAANPFVERFEPNTDAKDRISRPAARDRGCAAKR